MKSELKNISTIIFDLGGVVLNLDAQRSVKAFAKYSGLADKDIYSRFVDNDWSYAFEKGEISTSDFRDKVRKNINHSLTDTQIDEAWNAMLLDIPVERLELLSGLRKKYKTLVLSNTNAIHVKTFDIIVAKSSQGKRISQFFDKVYYSHEIGMRKPDLEIFTHVMEKNNLVPEETLFIDDMELNIRGAQQCGLKTVHLTNQDYLFELFS